MRSEEDFEKEEARARSYIRDQMDRAIALRSQDREFHGLEREFLVEQAWLEQEYDRTKDLKHPRDLGNARENILRRFLTEGGFLPKRYGVSDNSVRVVSTTGHISREIDIALYDPLDSVTLMKRNQVYEVYPVESVYGVIQVKSTLNKGELASALENLASFKRLDRCGVQGRGFAILFAYDSDMKWRDIVLELEAYAKANPARLWPNSVHILKRGAFRFGDGNGGYLLNSDIEAVREVQVYGLPDRQGLELHQFHGELLTLLRNTRIAPANPDAYYRLPLIAEDRSYSFVLGSFVEIGKCGRHGDFARKIPPEALEAITSWCKDAQPINWMGLIDPATGTQLPPQPGDTRIYNPEGLPLHDLLFLPTGPLAFDLIDTGGMRIGLPYYYAAKQKLLSDCPKCVKAEKAKERRRAKKKRAGDEAATGGEA